MIHDKLTLFVHSYGNMHIYMFSYIPSLKSMGENITCGCFFNILWRANTISISPTLFRYVYSEEQQLNQDFVSSLFSNSSKFFWLIRMDPWKKFLRFTTAKPSSPSPSPKALISTSFSHAYLPASMKWKKSLRKLYYPFKFFRFLNFF